MKKFYALALCAVLAFNISCGSDDNGDSSKVKGSLTVEEGKEQLEDNSIELLNKIEDFKDNDALSKIIELAEYLSPANTTKSSDSKNIALNTISNISSIEGTNKGIISFNAKQAVTVVDDSSLLDDYNEEKGIYNWNSETEEFDKTGTSDDIIYNIAYNNGKTAVFTVTDFNTTIAGGDDTEELPTLAKANLKIDGVTVFSQEYSATFQDGQLIPAKVNNTTTIADFHFITAYTNSNNSTVKQSFQFKLNSDVITGFDYTAKGNFNNEDGNVEDIFDSVSVSFQFLDAALTVSAKDDNFDSEDETLTIDEEIALLNSNTSAQLSINNKLIAESEFYKDEDTYTDYQYNSNSQSWEEVEITEDIINARFLFEDGTTNDFDTYFEGSFTELEDKFEAVFDAYEDLFGNIEID